jgi:Cu/Ag efflux protein CusF
MRRLACAGFVLTLALAACGRAPEVTGEVTAVDAERKVITLDHEAIPTCRCRR